MPAQSRVADHCRDGLTVDTKTLLQINAQNMLVLKHSYIEIKFCNSSFLSIIRYSAKIKLKLKIQ